jgi:hypothetical protein
VANPPHDLFPTPLKCICLTILPLLSQDSPPFSPSSQFAWPWCSMFPLHKQTKLTFHLINSYNLSPKDFWNSVRSHTHTRMILSLSTMHHLKVVVFIVFHLYPHAHYLPELLYYYAWHVSFSFYHNKPYVIRGSGVHEGWDLWMKMKSIPSTSSRWT